MEKIIGSFDGKKNHRVICWKESYRVICKTLFEETIILQARLWEWRDTVEAIWEDPAIKVD